MTGPNSFLADPRRRNLAMLLGAALAIILVALFALYEQSSRTAPQNARTEFFPGLASRVHQAARIHIASKKNGAFDIVFKPIKGWVLPKKGDYRASFVTLNQTLVDLAAMQTIEPKTARADWLHYIGLDAPDKGGDGVEIAVSDEHGRELAHLIVGKSVDIGDPGGAVGLFVRKPGEAQSWLVRAPGEFQTGINSWIDKNLIEIDAGAIQSTTVNHPDGASYEVTRDAKTDAHFKLAAIPAGRTLAAAEAPDGVGAAIGAFTFEDVKPLHEVDFTNAVRVTTRTFDGLSIIVEVAHTGTEYWAQVSAVNLSTKAEIAKQARTINTRAAGWAYKLPDYKGAQFTAPLESLLAPKGGKAPAVQDLPGQ